MTEIKSKLSTVTEQAEHLKSKKKFMTKNFIVFKTETSLIEIKYRVLDPLSLNEILEAS